MNDYPKFIFLVVIYFVIFAKNQQKKIWEAIGLTVQAFVERPLKMY